jgi:hypothetical protein
MLPIHFAACLKGPGNAIKYQPTSCFFCSATYESCLQEGMLPIHFAAWFNRLDVAALLLDKGSMINPPTKVKIVEGGRRGV